MYVFVFVVIFVYQLRTLPTYVPTYLHFGPSTEKEDTDER